MKLDPKEMQKLAGLTEAKQDLIGQLAEQSGSFLAEDFFKMAKQLWRDADKIEFQRFEQFMLDLSEEESWREQFVGEFADKVTESFDKHIRSLAKGR